MTTLKKKGANVYSILSYSVPRYHETKRSYVDFMCLDPLTNKLRRKKYHMDGIKTQRARRKYANELIAQLSERLRKGWNVWASQAHNVRQYTLYSEVCTYYLHYIERLAKADSIKTSTYLSYLSFFRIWNDWIARRQYQPIVYIYQFKPELVSDFLDYILLDRESSACTRNNYKVWLSTFCGWMVEKQYIDSNPCDKIRSLPETPKKREQFSAAQLKRLEEYLNAWNPHFLLACMIEYYCFIRPEELTNVKIEDISVKNQKITLSGSFTKNRHDGAVAINDVLIRMMVELGIFDNPGNWYLFGKRNFLPSPEKQEGRIFREAFQKVRKKLHMRDCYQFYSFKDTGIRDLANSEGIVVARDQARHSDISTTNKYLKGTGLTVHEEAKHFKGGL